jgi:enoyl-CoA hydratase
MKKIEIIKKNEIFIICMNRKEVINAIDKTTSILLKNYILEFDANPKYKVAILYGKHGNFCSGADLKSFSKSNEESLTSDGINGPLGPTR